MLWARPAPPRPRARKDFLMACPPSPPERIGPPERVIPGVAAVNLTLAETPRSVMALMMLSAYRGGFAFRISTLSRRPVALARPARRASTAPDDDDLAGAPTCRVEFSDGSVAEAGDDRPTPPDRPPRDPVLQTTQSEVHGPLRTTEFHVWPLPPPGPVGFVCRWPAGGVDEVRREIDAGVIHEAASRAIVLARDQGG
jgi:hypothetical protein